MKNEITPKQLAAARALVGWAAIDLAENSRVSVSTIRKFEAGLTTKMMPANAEAIVSVLNRAGVEFVFADGKVGVMITAPPV